MHRKEIIVLDATLLNVIGHAAFRAKLANGHCIVAYARRPDKGRAGELSPGDTVTVEMSPFDMSKGCIKFGSEDAT